MADVHTSVHICTCIRECRCVDGYDFDIYILHIGIVIIFTYWFLLSSESDIQCVTECSWICVHGKLFRTPDIQMVMDKNSV